MKRCLEQDLQDVGMQKQGLIIRKDPDADVSTRNSPAWRGGCGYTSPSPLSARSCSMKTLEVLRSASLVERRRSLSPQISQRRVDKHDAKLARGAPIMISVEGDLNLRFGRVHSIDSAGTYTIDLVGGGRKAGIREVIPCSEDDLQKEMKSKLGLITRKDAWDDMSTRNGPPKLCATPSPRLRGIAISPAPRNATRVSVPR